MEQGGTLVALNTATVFAIEAFDLPIRNAVEGLDPMEFYAPGTLFQLELDLAHDLTKNMPARTAAWFQRSPAFEITDARDIRVIGRYPADPDSVLLSGWVLHPERISNRAALIEARVGAGRVILFGFRPQYRAQSIATYPLFFNALKAPRRTTDR